MLYVHMLLGLLAGLLAAGLGLSLEASPGTVASVLALASNVGLLLCAAGMILRDLLGGRGDGERRPGAGVGIVRTGPSLGDVSD